MHTRASLERFGAEAMIPAGLAIALIRETGPLTAGLLVSGRVGAGIGAELGAMRVTEQIDALEANAVDAFHYLVVTRVIACVLAMPLLTVLMDFAGVLGGYVAEAASSGMSWQLYFQRSFSFIGYADLLPATLKTSVFGFLIATVSSYLGFNATGGTEGVGDASTRSVVLPRSSSSSRDVILVRLIFFLSAGGRVSGDPQVDWIDRGVAIRLDGVSKQFGGRAVLDNVTLDVPTGTAFCLLGRSGTGKSVTLRHIVGLVAPDSGRVFVEGRDVTALSRRELADVRKRMGFLFQNAALFDSLSVRENVAFPLRRHTDLAEDAIFERVRARLASVGLERDIDKMPSELSGRHAEARRSGEGHGPRPFDPARG